MKVDNCIFCKIIKGELPSYKVWEDDKYLAFLSIHPINPGHTLVIPKTHIPYLFDVEDEAIGKLIVTCKKVAQALKEAMNPLSGKIGVLVAGDEVPHTHIHLIPFNQASDLTFSRQKTDVPQEEFTTVQKMIQEALR